MRWTILLRPLGVAFGIYIVLNLALALERPELAATSIWLHLRLAEPALSVVAGVAGLALFVPHALAQRRVVRVLLVLVFTVFLSLAIDNTAAFYEDLWRGRLLTAVPVPLSLFLALLLGIELARVLWWRPIETATPAPAWVFFRSALVVLAFLGLTLVHVVTFGHVDHRQPADAAVIFGAKVYADGTPCAALVERLETGIDLYESNLVGCLIMTGAVDANGQSEPRVMREYALRRGVPSSRVLIDELGVNTRASASNVARLRAAHSLDRLLAVTQYFHCARVKMIFDREGATCLTVPTASTSFAWWNSPARLSREGFFLLREAIAFPFYMIYYR